MIKEETVNRFSDSRGFVFEPVQGELLANQRNTHVVVSRPGAVRGNHYHVRGTETLVVCGPALVRIREDNATRDISISADTTCRLIIPPGVAHAIQNTGEIDNLLVAFNTEPHDPDQPDLVQEILIPV
ncbi:cupin domain-containing protein [Desulfosarcina sp.]|uniref:polysaccharide biosynthesis C-terminal domain-containing protein n=1 Tax=Desulfosarcina sp. TaxID=2027861 RepID=UPI0029AD5F5D|nr:cupin domain-containing protein [Desulfosarcina sp.]MDX2451603.1 dTDP-4-dehydrorhamnose 3,5-epimerase family protein [Desulfosarcina sp.]MDX2489395.1 dTDP-4-dehydrorhamnose 3,5-epimerase family protein [Desulfosarcina sp.]